MQATYPVFSSSSSTTLAPNQSQAQTANTFPRAQVVRNIYNEVDAIVFGPEPPAVESQAYFQPSNFGFGFRGPFWR